MPALLAFVLGPVGRWIVIGLAFLAWTAYQRDQAADKARQECQAEQLQKTVVEITRQRDAAKAALRAAEAQAEITRREMTDLEKARDEIVAELGEVGKTVCVIPDDVVKRLRNIR